MYEYTEVTDNEGFHDVPLPTSGGAAVIKFPKRLDHAQLKRVRSAGYYARINPQTGEAEDAVDMSAYWDTMAKVALCDPRTQHELYHAGKKIQITPEYIDHKMQPIDVLRIGQQLVVYYAEQLGTASADPNVDTSNGSNGKVEKPSLTSTRKTVAQT